MPPTARRFLAPGLLSFVVVAWGGSFVAARHLLAPGGGEVALSPTLLAAARFLIAAAALAPFLPRRPLPLSPSPAGRGGTSSPASPAGKGARGLGFLSRDLLTFLLLGQVGVSLYFWLQYTGVRLTSAGVAAVLVVGLIPLATLLVAGIFLHEGLGWWRALALLLGAAGVLVVAGQQGISVALESGYLLGALCLVGDALLFAVYSTLVRGLRRRYSALQVTAGTTVAGALGLCLVAGVGEDWGSLLRLSPAQWGAVLYLALVCSVLAYLAYNRALAEVEASRAAAWLYLEPAVALALGALLLGEAVALQTILGGAIIVAALYLAGRAR